MFPLNEWQAELAKPAKKGVCDCEDAKQAKADGILIPVYNVGWVFTDVPRRRVDWRVCYQADGDGSHDGEPVGWVTCPFCGESLPEINDGPTTSEGPE